LEALGELSASVAHDFNNALASILSNAEMLQAELAARGEETILADEIEAVAQAAGQLTANCSNSAGSSCAGEL